MKQLTVEDNQAALQSLVFSAYIAFRLCGLFECGGIFPAP